MLIDKLEKFGLSNKEAKVYLCLLELGTAVVSEVAKKSHINRSTTYVLLESLAKQGLVSISEKKSIRLYSPAAPERIIQMAEESVKKYSDLVEVGQLLLPELKSMYKGVGTKPTVQYFEGIEGIKTAYEDTLTSKESIRGYTSFDATEDLIPNYYPMYYQRRAEKNIPIKLFSPDTANARDRAKHNKEELREAILLPQKDYDFASEINIYDDKVAFMAIKEKFAIIIESKEITDGFKKLFDIAWNNTKEKKS